MGLVAMAPHQSNLIASFKLLFLLKYRFDGYVNSP